VKVSNPSAGAVMFEAGSLTDFDTNGNDYSFGCREKLTRPKLMTE